MTADNIPILSPILHFFQKSSEADGVRCCACHCGLPPNNWKFASNECLVSSRRYDDDVVCFYTEHADVEECYEASLAFSLTPEANLRQTHTIRRSRILDYVRVGGPISRYENQDGYYCLNCFASTEFRTKGVPSSRIKNEAATLCNTYNIGVRQLPSF